MKKIITLGTALAAWLISAAAGAQTLGNLYVNAFTLESDGSQGGYEFGFGWEDPALLRIDQSGDSVTFYPNTSLCNDDPAWCGAGELGGNWYIEASAFAETAVSVGDPAQDFEFKGCFDNSTLTSNHELVAFMQVLNPDDGYSIYEGTQQLDSYGCWKFTHSEDGSANAIVQYGLKLMGQNVDPEDASEAGAAGATLNVDPRVVENDPNAIPTLPLVALLGLLGVVGVFGARKARTRV